MLGQLVDENPPCPALAGHGVATADDPVDDGRGTSEDGGDVSDRVCSDSAGGGGDTGEDSTQNVDLMAVGARVDNAFGDALDSPDAGGVSPGGNR